MILRQKRNVSYRVVSLWTEDRECKEITSQTPHAQQEGVDVCHTSFGDLDTDSFTWLVEEEQVKYVEYVTVLDITYTKKFVLWMTQRTSKQE